MAREAIALTTPRLRLEPTRGEHAGALWNAIERSLPELKRWMSWAGTTSPERISEYTLRAQIGWDDWVNWDFVIFLGDQVAGSTGINRFDSLWRVGNLGYWIRSDLAGQGLATEAARAVVDFAFVRLELNRVELVADVANKASQRVAEKVGFEREGIKRQGTWVDGRGVDVYLYGLLATDPRPGI